MHIVFTSNLYLPVMGGSVMVLDRWAHALVDLGHQVTILTKTHGDGIHSLAEWQSADANVLRVCRFHGLRESISILRHADRVVMIEMSLNWLLAIALAGKRPLVTHHTHFVPYESSMRPYRLLQWAACQLIPAVACSRMIANQWGRHTGVVPNPYDQHTFFSKQAYRDVDFLFAGRFGREKGISILIEALQSLAPDFLDAHGRLPRVAFAGKGPQENEIRTALNSSNPFCEIAYLGEASPTVLAHWYQRSKVVVIPSIWQEPFGLIGIEALACGCHIVCSDQPGLREATAGFARYCPTGDAPAFANAMLESIPCGPIHVDLATKIHHHLRRHHLIPSAQALLNH